MRLPSLVQRGSQYYFQCRVPVDLAPYFPYKQIRKTLKTNNRKHAISRVKSIAAATERLFFMARSGLLTPKLIQSLVQEYMDTMLDLDKRERYGIAESDFDTAVMQQGKEFRERYLMDSRKDYELPDESGEITIMTGADNLADYYRALSRRCNEQARKQDYGEIAPIASGLLMSEGVDLRQDSPEFHMFCDSLLAKEAEAHEVLALRAERVFNNEYDRKHATNPLQRRKKLSALVARYIELHTSQDNARTKQKPDEVFGKILELLGNPYTDEINQDSIVQLFDDLATYPKYRNHAHMKGLTLEQCKKHSKYEPLDPTTFKGVWFALGSLLTYGAENGEYGIARNYCKDKVCAVKLKALTKTKQDKLERLPYSQDDIQNLIIQLNKKYRLRFEPHKLWIPLIAVYNGMRQSEICQLFCDDIIRVDGIDCFRIRDCAERHQSVKNEQSNRTIPIHPTLIELGFMDFVASRRKLKYDRVWQGMKNRPVDYYDKSDNYSHYFEKWFNDTFRKYVILDKQDCKQKPFHSLRHTFINWFFQNIKSQDRDNAAVKGMAGHLESDEQKMVTAMLKGISWETYSQELKPGVMLESLKLLDYGVDLKPLGLPMKW